MNPDLGRSQLITAARELSAQVDCLRFKPPVTHVYNPLNYAWRAHEEYLRRFGSSPKRVVFLGMNPGPFGMVQTGIPFGEIAAVRGWLGIRVSIETPKNQHLRRPILGFDCPRSEVSGRRLWGLLARRFGSSEQFFADHFVANYCPLAFCEAGGRNLTPDKLSATERDRLFSVCDQHLWRLLEILQPEWLIGVGDFAGKRGELAVANTKVRVGRILHPSPASPAANRRDWGTTATRQLVELGVWR